MDPGPSTLLPTSTVLPVASSTEGAAVTTDQSSSKAKRKPKTPATLFKEPGKSLLPATRVQKILKADKELPTVAKDAVFLISLATEEFVKRLSEACHNIASRDKRVTVQQKDVASVVRRADEFLFLEEIIPWPDPNDVPQRRKPGQKKAAETSGAGSTMLDNFLTIGNSPPNELEEDVVTNEDGTLQTAGPADNDEPGL